MFISMKKALVAGAAVAAAALAGPAMSSAAVADVSAGGVGCGVLGSNPNCTVTATGSNIDLYLGDPANGGTLLARCENQFSIDINTTGTTEVYNFQITGPDLCEDIDACPEPARWHDELFSGPVFVYDTIELCLSTPLGEVAGSLSVDTNVTSAGGTQTLTSATTTSAGRPIGSTGFYVVGTWAVSGGLSVTP